MFYIVNDFLVENDMEFVTILHDPLNNEELHGKHFDFFADTNDTDDTANDSTESIMTFQEKLDEESLSQIQLINLANASNLVLLKAYAITDAKNVPDSLNSRSIKDYYLNILEILTTTLFYKNGDLYYNDIEKTYDETLNDLDLIRDYIFKKGFYGYYLPKIVSVNDAYTIGQHVNIKVL